MCYKYSKKHSYYPYDASAISYSNLVGVFQFSLDVASDNVYSKGDLVSLSLLGLIEIHTSVELLLW